MATSDFKIFANGQSLVGEETLNIAPLDDEQLVTETKTGFYSGLASSKKFNRVLRQGTAGTATIADLIVEVLAEDVKDDGTPLKDQLRRAITKTVELDTKSFVRTINGVAPDASGDAVGGDTLNAEVLAACDKALTGTTGTQNDEFINSFAEKLRSIGTLHALGDTWISFDSTVPAGGVPFCGQLVSRNLWADLYAWATAQGKVKTESEWQEYATAHGGNCPYYSSGDNDTNFRMPKVSAYFKGADSAEEGGTWIAEGLPNIEGSFSESDLGRYGRFDGDGTGAFTRSIGSYGGVYGHQSGTSTRFSFDASLSNPIYGNSSHVTPETCTVLVGVYAVGVVSTVGSTDVDKISSAIAALESNALAKSTPHIVEVFASDDGASWYRKFSDGRIEQGGCIASPSSSQIVSLSQPFSSDGYTLLTTIVTTRASASYDGELFVREKTKSNFTIGSRMTDTTSISWFASGF